jgi:hypothetical protein
MTKTTTTYVSSPYNSTPFSSCCNVASLHGVCAECGAEVTYHDDGLSARRREVPPGHCLMCGKHRDKCNC